MSTHRKRRGRRAIFQRLMLPLHNDKRNPNNMRVMQADRAEGDRAFFRPLITNRSLRALFKRV